MHETPPRQPVDPEPPVDLLRIRKARDFAQALERAFFDPDSPLMHLVLETTGEMHARLRAAIQEASAELIREYRAQTGLTDAEWTAATRSI